MLNIGSLVLGFCAWILAILAIAVPKASASHKSTIVSFSLCAISLVLQLFEVNRLVLIGDYAAIEDTIRAILIAAIVLVSVTVILNLVGAGKRKNKYSISK